MIGSTYRDVGKLTKKKLTGHRLQSTMYIENEMILLFTNPLNETSTTLPLYLNKEKIWRPIYSNGYTQNTGACYLNFVST